MPTVIATKGSRMEPSSSAGAGWAAAKIAAAFGVPAFLAALFGLLLMPPTTVREFVMRICTTVVCSFLFGPLLAAAVMTWLPGLTESAQWLADSSGIKEFPLGMFYVLGPCMLIAGLPGWWILGAYLRWTARLKNEDLSEWIGNSRRSAGGES